jgi:deoxyadenosine/deoxycytidine kinase
MRIEIAGIIASGKTTLAQLLSERDLARGVFENFEANPFFRAFYADPRSNAFETEVTFLLQHYHLIRRGMSAQEAPRVAVCDFALALDLAYAITTLGHDELQAFMPVHEHVSRVLAPPDLLLVLQCSPREALRRIRKRGRVPEQSIDVAYLEALSASLLSNIAPEMRRVLFIDSEVINFAANSKDQEAVLRRIITADATLFRLP